MPAPLKNKGPFNVSLPDNAQAVRQDDKLIGYVWSHRTAPLTVDASIAHLAVQKDRWGSMTVDGIVISKNSRTYREAVKSLKAGIARRGTDQKVSRADPNRR